ncbi:hypothetical protein [Pseudomonas sp. TH10]|uniref:hypothetical protein n=1 Tax=Pseudomonas sp. TH10 TaxID=2796376 RepID=UPI00237AF95D|nr:hypothetical protein [Pseudomonas sp. TH10]
MTYCFLAQGQVSIHDDRWFIPPWGVNGGEPAQRSWKRCWSVPVASRFTCLLNVMRFRCCPATACTS